jgi:hypothetical protein
VKIRWPNPFFMEIPPARQPAVRSIPVVRERLFSNPYNS